MDGGMLAFSLVIHEVIGYICYVHVSFVSHSDAKVTRQSSLGSFHTDANYSRERSRSTSLLA